VCLALVSSAASLKTRTHGTVADATEAVVAGAVVSATKVTGMNPPSSFGQAANTRDPRDRQPGMELIFSVGFAWGTAVPGPQPAVYLQRP
jgi:hypothetical protein